MLGSSAMYSMCISGCGTRAGLVCAGVCGFEKEAGLVISETTCGGRPSAGNSIASNDCIKSIGRILGNKRLSVSEEEDPVGRRNSLQVTKEGGFVSFFSELGLDFFLESGERDDEDEDLCLGLSELACWTAGEMECPTSYIDDEDGANGIYNADSGWV